MEKRWIHQDIETPVVVINLAILKNNVTKMATFAKKNKVKLRPHMKTHKMAEILQMQLDEGAIGITTAKLGEAEIMAEHGATDILIAYPIIGDAKLQRLKKLKEKIQVSTVVDGIEQAGILSAFAKSHDLTFDLYIEVDTGLKRCGVEPGESVKRLFTQISGLDGIRINGIMTHAGHVYGAPGYEQVKEIARYEGDVMVETANLLRQDGIHVKEVSVGSTPTVHISGTVDRVTEIRPGNYVFNDMTQVRLGVAAIEDCSLRVCARIVSHPAPDRFVIDAGAKTLALDQGAHGTTGVKGYGYVVEHPELTITRLSEEHGVVQIEGSTSLTVGDLVEIIPNHSCPVVNLTDVVTVVHNGEVVDQWKVAARGKTQ